MASKKTINVTAIVDNLHSKIALAKSVEAKAAYCSAIEEILFATNNYNGFTYNHSSAMAAPYYDRYNRHEITSAIDEMIKDGLLTEYDRVYTLYR
jgi:hypothetical protein